MKSFNLIKYTLIFSAICLSGKASSIDKESPSYFCYFIKNKKESSSENRNFDRRFSIEEEDSEDCQGFEFEVYSTIKTKLCFNSKSGNYRFSLFDIYISPLKQDDFRVCGTEEKAILEGKACKKVSIAVADKKESVSEESPKNLVEVTSRIICD